MNRLQYLLTKLAEEASEVAQIVLKAQQFGLKESIPTLPYTNEERIYQELNDLNAILVMLKEYDFNYEVDQQQINNKIAKVNKYHGYSVELGMVHE